MASSVQLTLHWLDRSRAQRIIWLLEELRLQYRVVTYKRLPDQQAPASLKAIHPLGKSPVLEVNRPQWNKPLVLAESASIVEYVTEHFGSSLVPQKWQESGKDFDPQAREETQEWLRYRYYMHYAEGSLMNLIGIGALKNGIKDAPVPFFVKPFTRIISGKLESDYLNHNFESHFTFLESELASFKSLYPTPEHESFYICGPKITPADFMMAFPLEAGAQIAGLTEQKYPLLTGYLKMVMGRESYKKAIERIVKETGSYVAGI